MACGPVCQARYRGNRTPERRQVLPHVLREVASPVSKAVPHPCLGRSSLRSVRYIGFREDKRLIHSVKKSVSLLRGAGLVLGPTDMTTAKAEFLVVPGPVGQPGTGQVITKQYPG